MYREFYALVPVHPALFGLMVFVGIFLAMLAWIYVPRRGQPTFDDVARLPLQDFAPTASAVAALLKDEGHA